MSIALPFRRRLWSAQTCLRFADGGSLLPRRGVPRAATLRTRRADKSAPAAKRGQVRALQSLRRKFFHVFFALFASFAVALPHAAAAEPFFKKGDVIAIVGGEDMVAMSEHGYLELLLTRALPGHRLKFRNLAWEGDTVFEQRRDLNFPPLEAQLDQVGATVVLCQFGQMESLAGREKLPEFVAAYEKLITRIAGPASVRDSVPYLSKTSADWKASVPPAPGKPARRVLVILPARNPVSEMPTPALKNATELLPPYALTTAEMAVRLNCWISDTTSWRRPWIGDLSKDGIHLSKSGHWLAATRCALALGIHVPLRYGPDDLPNTPPAERFEPLLQLITAKNRLWFDYWRVQNWAFLAGDRTEQPSSRDHVDRTKRWFPAEREQFLPLIEAKEQEIWTLAAKLAQP